MNDDMPVTMLPTDANTSSSSAVDALSGKRIAIISYPTLFQTQGGMAMKVRKTVRALASIGVDATLPNLIEESINDFDLVHIFGAFNSNDRVVTLAKGLRKPVVVSPVLMPPFSRSDGRRARLVDRVARKLTGWTVGTTYGQIRTALDGADKLIALGITERDLLIAGYQQSAAKVVIVPNGVGEQFFTATPDLFLQKFELSKPMVLHVGIVGKVKNQLGLIRSLHDEDLDIFLAGPCSDHDRAYLQRCLSEGRGRVRYLGEFRHGDELLTSAYAAASVLAVPSFFEGMSNCVLEALAAGTPVVTTKYHSWDYKADPSVVIEVEPTNFQEIRAAVCALLKTPKPRSRCQAVVASLSWTAVAKQIAEVYASVASVSGDAQRPARALPLESDQSSAVLADAQSRSGVAINPALPDS